MVCKHCLWTVRKSAGQLEEERIFGSAVMACSGGRETYTQPSTAVEQPEVLEAPEACQRCTKELHTAARAKEVPALHMAAHRGRADLARVLLDGGANIDAMCTCRRMFGYGSKSQLADNEGTALHVAVHEGHTDVVELLLGLKANVGADDLTALHLAVATQRPEIVDMLLAAGADPSAAGGNFTWKMYPKEYAGAKMTPLHLGAMHGRADLVRMLLAAGADRSAMCPGSLVQRVVPTMEFIEEVTGTSIVMAGTPLHYAAAARCVEAVKLLLEPGARGKAQLETVSVGAAGASGATPLHCALCGWVPHDNGGTEDGGATLQFLLDAGADPNAKAEEGKCASTPLSDAAEGADISAVKMLLAAKVDLSYACRKGVKLPLVALAQGYKDSRRETADASLECMKLLLAAGADPNCNATNLKYNGGALLHFVRKAMSGIHPDHPDRPDQMCGKSECSREADAHLEGMELLLAAGADPNAIDSELGEGCSALHYAAHFGAADAAKVLLGAGANANAVDGIQWTPLHHATEKASIEVAKVLLDAGANISLETQEGCTPLLQAAFNAQGNVQAAVLVKLLLDAGADVTTTNVAAMTALHLAVKGAEVRFENRDAVAKNWGDSDEETLRKTIIREAVVETQCAIVRHIVSAGGYTDAKTKTHWYTDAKTHCACWYSRDRGECGKTPMQLAGTGAIRATMLQAQKARQHPPGALVSCGFLPSLAHLAQIDLFCGGTTEFPSFSKS